MAHTAQQHSEPPKPSRVRVLLPKADLPVARQVGGHARQRRLGPFILGRQKITVNGMSLGRDLVDVPRLRSAHCPESPSFRFLVYDG